MTASTQTMFGMDALSRLADQYFDRLGLDWRRRKRMLDSRDAGFPALEIADVRMHAAAEAFTHLGLTVCQTGQRLVDPMTARDLFAATIQAVITQESRLFAACMAVAGTLPGMGTAFLEAVDWCAAISPENTERAWRGFKPEGGISDIHLLFALASLRSVPRGQSAHQWAKPLLDAATDRPCTLAYSFGLARLHGWPQWDVKAGQALAHADVSVRAAAVRFLLTRGSASQRQAACQTGAVIACDAGPQGDTLVGPLILENNQAASHILASLEQNPALQQRFAEALAWSGLVRAIDWLIPILGRPAQARHAAQAITILTGSDPRHDGWQAAPPEAVSSADHAHSYSRPVLDLPWPDKDRFEGWWSSHRKNFDPGQRYLLGRLINRSHVFESLYCEALRWRPMLAWHLQSFIPGCVLMTDLPASSQHAYLSRFSETRP